MANATHSAAPPRLEAVAPLPDGPVDVVGDIHGEIEALDALLAVLGYREDGSHPAGRRLVFVGDLCDRGPDSPGVIRRVMGLIAGGRAQCVLGNHELNVLRGAEKAGNGWFFPEDHDVRRGRFVGCARATAADREEFRAFFAGLPLALERSDLRVVHAAWHGASLRELADGGTAPADVVGRYRVYQEKVEQEFRHSEYATLVRQEYESWGRHLENPEARVPLLPGIAWFDTRFQMLNPVRVVTSGVERPADAAFFASGRWRMVDRVPWWDEYVEDVPVIFGHYWRWAMPAGQRYSRGEPDLFHGQPPNALLGPLGTAFCVDFSVGVRYRERPRRAGVAWLGRLGAVRWPERELVFDDGETLPLLPP